MSPRLNLPLRPRALEVAELVCSFGMLRVPREMTILELSHTDLFEVDPLVRDGTTPIG